MTDSRSPVLTLLDLSRPGVEPVSLEVCAGEAVALLGPSGSGKSLLLRAIADLDQSEGEVRLRGSERNRMSGPEWRRKVTYLAAEPGWWESYVASHFPDLDRARERMPDLGLSPDMLERPIAELSTGERQRLALLRVLCQDPDVMLLDEPTGNLDQASVHHVEDVLRKRVGEGTAILFATHDEDLASRLADRVVRVAQGGRFSEEFQASEAPA